MVGLFVRLKLRLLAGALRSSSSRAAALVLSVCAGVAVAALGLLGFAGLRGSGAPVGQIGVVAYAVLALGWALLPLIAFSSDETLDPSRLALLPLTRRQLVSGLFAASLVGVPALVSAFVLAGSVVGLSGGPLSVLIGAGAALIELALCVALSRALSSALSGLLRSRRGRDLAVLIGLLLAVAVQGLNLALQELLRHGGAAVLVGVARVARWTPPGMLAHAITDARHGLLGAAVGELVVGLVTVLLLVRWWQSTLTRAMVTSDASTQRVRTRSGAAARRLPRLPAGRTGAVAGKELRYAWRDPRRKSGWASALLIGVLAPIFPLLTAGVAGSPLVVYVASAPALLAGMQTMNQFGMDGAGGWLHVVATGSPADVRADFAGRNLAAAMIAVPALLLVAAALGVATANPQGAVAALGLALAVLGVGLGMGNVISVLAPYPVGDRPTDLFSGGSPGRGCLVGTITLVAMGGVFLACLPVIVLSALLALLAPAAQPVLLVLGPGYGICGAWLGRRIGCERAFRRLPELFAQSTRPVG